jgi:hypothetical protein
MPGREKLDREIRGLAEEWAKTVREKLGKGYRGGLNWTWNGGGATIGFGVYHNIGGRWIARAQFELAPLSEVGREDYDEVSLAGLNGDEAAFNRAGELEREYISEEIEEFYDDNDYRIEMITKEMLKLITLGKVEDSTYDLPRESPFGSNVGEYFLYREYLSGTQGPYYGA